MFKKNTFISFCLLVVICLAALAGCLGKPPVKYQPFNQAVYAGKPPHSIAVLPFRNHTEFDGVAQALRTYFYAHLATLPYRDVELAVVDRILNQDFPRWREKLDPVAVGQKLGCEAIVIGEVLECQQFYAGIYADLSVDAQIEVYDTGTGERIWIDRMVQHNREGGLPLSVLSLPLIGLRTGLKMRETEALETINKLAWSLASKMPVPGILPEKEGYRYAVQLGAYLDKDNARRILDTLQEKGFSARIELGPDKANTQWHRIVMGPYPDLAAAKAAQKELAAEIDKNIGESIVVPVLAPIASPEEND